MGFLAISCKKIGHIETDKTGRKSNLKEEHVNFTNKFYEDSANIGKTIQDLLLLLVEAIHSDYD